MASAPPTHDDTLTAWNWCHAHGHVSGGSTGYWFSALEILQRISRAFDWLSLTRPSTANERTATEEANNTLTYTIIKFPASAYGSYWNFYAKPFQYLCPLPTVPTHYVLLAAAVTYNLIQPSTRAWRLASERAVQIKWWSKEWWCNRIQKQNEMTPLT